MSKTLAGGSDEPSAHKGGAASAPPILEMSFRDDPAFDVTTPE